MPRWVVLVPVTVDAVKPEEAIAWVQQELAAKLDPDNGTGWHREADVCPRYQVGSIRRVVEESPVPERKRGQASQG